jgi:peptidyl-prolyl cis-trans isomerase C
MLKMNCRRRPLSAAALALVLLVPLLQIAGCAKDDAAAVVNGESISRQKYELAKTSMARRVGGAMGGDSANALSEDPEIGRATLENLIAVELLYQEAKKQGYAASPEAVDRSVQALRSRYPSEAEFDKDVKSKGFTRKMLAEDAGKQIMVENYIMRGLGVEEPGAEEVADFYAKNAAMINSPERVKASHILLKVKPDATEADKAQVRTRAVELASRARKGEDFAALAQANSEDGSASKGGDLGYFMRGQMVPPFEKAAFSLRVGAISDPVPTQFGWHVIKVIDHKPGGRPPLEEVRTSISDYLKGMKTQAAMEGKLKELRAAAKIETLVTFQKPAAAATVPPAN